MLSLRIFCLSIKSIQVVKRHIHSPLTLKVPITTAADDSLEYFFIVFHCFSVTQRIHMKHQLEAVFFLWKEKVNKIKVSSFAWLFNGLKKFGLYTRWKNQDFDLTIILIFLHCSW